MVNRKLEQILSRYRDNIIEFTREMVRVNSHTGDEEDIIVFVKEKMESLGFDDVFMDSFGNVTASLGSGKKIILFDSHLDIVEPGVLADWTCDPFGGDLIDGKIYGRGSADMKGGMSASLYAALVARDLGFLDGKKVIISASIMEEDYEGEALRALFDERKLDVQGVVICEPSSLKMARGHKGRALLKIETSGVSAHGSAPSLGKNALYKMIPVIERVRILEERSQKYPLGSTWALTKIDVDSVSYNAIPGSCSIYLDRRLVVGETREQLVSQMETLVEDTDASWEFVVHNSKTWRGRKFRTEIHYPAWEMDENHNFMNLGRSAFRASLGGEVETLLWNFSTNGVYTAGVRGIPSLGFGPGNPDLAHKVDEYCSVEEIIGACSFYTMLIKHF